MTQALDFDPIAYINTPRWQHVELGLERIEQLLNLLGRPQDSLRFIHVAGTNGKGSVCAYIATTLQIAGYKTGLFTSPYIEQFEERIRIDGQNIAYDELCEVTLEVKEAADSMADHPTEFELMCAVALLHFAKSKCDIVVLEVGLGGRYDATNVIAPPLLAIICRLGLDHTEILGDTLAKIAAEKAGIIKPRTHVISYPQESEALEVIQHVCKKQDATLEVCDLSELSQKSLNLEWMLTEVKSHQSQALRTFTYRGCTYQTQLLGNYQPQNAALAIDALQYLQTQGLHINQMLIEAGIKQTQWPARFEVCATHPLFIVDGGHNPQGAMVMAQTLSELLGKHKPVFIVGILADKDYPAMLQAIVSHGASFVCVTPPNPRALTAGELGEKMSQIAREMGFEADVHFASNFYDAVVQARTQAGYTGAVCAFGSLYSVGSIKQALQNVLKDEAQKTRKALRLDMRETTTLTNQEN